MNSTPPTALTGQPVCWRTVDKATRQESRLGLAGKARTRWLVQPRQLDWLGQWEGADSVQSPDGGTWPHQQQPLPLALRKTVKKDEMINYKLFIVKVVCHTTSCSGHFMLFNTTLQMQVVAHLHNLSRWQCRSDKKLCLPGTTHLGILHASNTMLENAWKA